MKKTILNVFKMLTKIVLVVLVAYLAFFCYLATHEWAGHLLADALVFARHGTYFDKFVVVVQSLIVRMEAGRWSLGLVPFRIGAEVDIAIPHDLFTLTDWEIGFSNLMGCGITTLISLITLTVLTIRKNVGRFPWFAVFFSLSSVIFDQILYTFTGPDPEPLVSAVLMGINPLLFKGIVIGLVLLQVWLLVRFVLRYRRARRVGPLHLGSSLSPIRELQGTTR